MAASIAERARALEHARYAAAADATPALLEEAAARLRRGRVLDAGQQLWLALLAHGSDRLLFPLAGIVAESKMLRAACPLPGIVDRIDEAERAALSEQARDEHARDQAALAEQARLRAVAGPVVATYLDVIASSSSDAAFPIEVGWATLHANGTIDSGCCFIRPEAAWADWSADAEARHQIPRVMTEALGQPAAEVAADLDGRFGDGVVYVEVPDRAALWVDRLYGAIATKRRWRIGEAQGLAQSLVATNDERAALAQWRSTPRCHRAEADAYRLAQTHRVLRELAMRRRRGV